VDRISDSLRRCSVRSVTRMPR